jgi:hypothetical protein
LISLTLVFWPSTCPELQGAGQPGGDGVDVVAQSLGELPQIRQCGCAYGVDPGWESVAAEVFHHRGERSDVVDGGVDLGAAVADVSERGGVVGVQLAWLGQDPGGGLAWGGLRSRWWRGDGGLLEQPDVVTDRGWAAPVALGLYLAEQLGRVALAGVVLLVEEGFEAVEQGAPVGHGHE